MSLDKVLNRIQGQIHELAPTLELFVEESIQPSVNDCENLQSQLIKLQECLAVYKHYKRDKELSPSFNIHSKVSEKNIEPVKVPDPAEIKEVVKEIIEEQKVEEREEVLNNAERTNTPVTIGINDKFRFINELFKQNNAEYNIAIEQINSLSSWVETETYLSSLKMIYGWKDNSETVNQFYALIKKRFA